MSRTKGMAALAGLLGMIAGVLVAVPAQAATSTLTSVNFDDSTTGAWTQSGGGGSTLGYVDNGAGKALSVARTADYVGIQSPVGIFTAGTTYTITAKIKLAEGTAGTTSARFVMKPAYSWIGNTSGISAADWTTVTGQYTVPDDADIANLQLYIGTDKLSDNSENYTYLVDDLTVTHEVQCTDGPTPGTVLLSADFEDGLQGWVPREGAEGAHSVAVTTSDKHGGAQSALVSDRTSQGSGIGFDVQGLLEPGVQYELTAWAKFAGTPTADLVLTGQTGESTFTTLKTFTEVNSETWTQINAKFSIASGDRAFIYFETPWSSSDAIGNTTSFMIDDLEIKVPDAVQIQDLTPIKDTVSFPVGVAIDSRETAGPGSTLLLKHFNQVTPENFMKPEAWYDSEGNFAPSSEITSLMDFAKANDLRVYGHVLVWHSQTPAWFFNKSATDSTPLTNSEADKQLLRDRLEKHIDDVAKYLSDNWGAFGDGNPIVAFDVVNEVVNDGASPETGGLRNSRWYQILGDEYIADAFRDADAAFNGTYAAAGADRPVKLFINDYNTEQSGKRARYLTLINSLIAGGVPIDGMGHQFHVSLATPVSAMDEALTAGEATGLLQAVTEFDAPTGTPESEAKFIDQGYYYRDAFNIFRAHASHMFSVTVWGLTDGRSWRDSSGGPLVFDDGFQAKPAYYGIADPGDLPATIRTANAFEGDVPATAEGVASGEWKLLPLLPAGANAQFQTRWSNDHLSVYVDVDDATVDATDAVTVQVGDDDYSLLRSGGALGTVVARDGGYTAVLHVPLASAALGDTIHLDVRVTDGAATDGWNSPGATGTVTLVEPLSHVDVPEAAIAPVIDGTLDDVWSTSAAVQTLKQVSGVDGAIGTFHLLWKGQTLYVYADVADPTVDTTGSDPWVQDSVEIYLDGGNAKNGSYRYDDTQIRLSADGVVSFGTGDEAFQANRLQSSATRVDGGYVVEAAISLLEYGGLGTVHGLDVQVNDATGGSRTAIRNWADPTGTGYQTTSRWGVASLVAGTLIDQAAFTPVISGGAVVGQTLHVDGLPAGSTLSYRWLRNGTAIGGATGASYKLTTSDAGKRISVSVTSVRAGYADLTRTSAQTATVLKTFTKTSAPTISGKVAVGSKLTAKVSPWAPSASFSYQWYSNGKAIHGATKSTFTPTRSQAGTTLVVKVTGSKSGYLSASRYSSGKKVPLLTLRVGPTWISGPTHVGGTLKVTPGKSSPVTAVKTYQWYRNGWAISGATSSTYKLTSSDQGKRLTVKVTYRAQGFATKVVVAGPTFRIAAR